MVKVKRREAVRGQETRTESRSDFYFGREIYGSYPSDPASIINNKSKSLQKTVRAPFLASATMSNNQVKLETSLTYFVSFPLGPQGPLVNESGLTRAVVFADLTIKPRNAKSSVRVMPLHWTYMTNNRPQCY